MHIKQENPAQTKVFIIRQKRVFLPDVKFKNEESNPLIEYSVPCNFLW